MDPSPIELTDQLRNDGYPLHNLNRTESNRWSPGASPTRVSFPAPAYWPVALRPGPGWASRRQPRGGNWGRIQRMDLGSESGGQGSFGLAWFLLCLAFCAHVADEALTGFLGVYNPTVLAMRSQYQWFPMPTFEYRDWLTMLIVANIVLLLLTPFAFRNAGWLRPLAYFYATVHLLNGMGHTVATIFGQTVSTVHFARPAPGFYSSPLLLAGSIYLFMRLRASRRSQNQAAAS